MLGHSGIQTDKNKILSIISKTICREEEIIQLFVLLLAKDSVIPSLHQCFNGQLIKFLDLFSGCVIKVENKEKYCHLPEIRKFFGEEAANKFKFLFQGMSVKIPNSASVSTTIRDIDIYCRLRDCTDRKSTVKMICSHYNMKTYEVSWVFRKISRNLIGNG